MLGDVVLIGLMIRRFGSVVMMVRWLWGFVRWRFREDFRELNINFFKKKVNEISGFLF